jgi:hypothetical protein
VSRIRPPQAPALADYTGSIVQGREKISDYAVRSGATIAARSDMKHRRLLSSLLVDHPYFPVVDH